KVGDLCVVEAGQLIPGDGDVVEGIAAVDESAITGESAPVIRESGGDRSAVTGGTRVLSDRIVVKISTKPGESFIDRMIALVEGASRQKTPNEIALNILLAGLTVIFLLAVVTLEPFAVYSHARQSVTVLVALLAERSGLEPRDMPGAELVPFTAQTRMSGIEWDGRSIRKGAADSVRRWVEERGGHAPADLGPIVERIAVNGGTPLVVAEGPQVMGVIHLKDTIKTGMVERFADMRAMGIRTVMITGDNPLTAKAIADEAGVDDFMAEATPEDKMGR